MGRSLDWGAVDILIPYLDIKDIKKFIDHLLIITSEYIKFGKIYGH